MRHLAKQRKRMRGLEDKQSVSITDTARILGKSPQFVRIGLQRQLLPFGVAVQMSSKWTYHISPKLLQEYVGKTL